MDDLDLEAIDNTDLRSYFAQSREITTIISCALSQIRAGIAEHMLMKQALWDYIRDNNPALFKVVRKGIVRAS